MQDLISEFRLSTLLYKKCFIFLFFLWRDTINLDKCHFIDSDHTGTGCVTLCFSHYHVLGYDSEWYLVPWTAGVLQRLKTFFWHLLQNIQILYYCFSSHTTYSIWSHVCIYLKSVLQVQRNRNFANFCHLEYPYINLLYCNLLLGYTSANSMC